MPRFIIKLKDQQDQVFELLGDEIIIGRGEECDLILPNISVSREHAVVQISSANVQIIDLQSGNGLIVNNKTETKCTLSSQDEILIGNFSLIFLGDSAEDRLYRDRSITYLPKYDHRKASSNQDATFKLSAKDTQALMREKSLLNNGCIVDEEGNPIYPEANTISFGGQGAKIKIKHWLTIFSSGIYADITWDGKRHIIEKKNFFVPVKVNKDNIEKYPLKEGDSFSVGNSTFKYILEQ
ncbi:MAG: hypothetical protein CMK59_12105 [Proteobacteria bacterium]|nr:hypothetical protein [Pseudomonadota bacterium]